MEDAHRGPLLYRNMWCVKMIAIQTIEGYLKRCLLAILKNLETGSNQTCSKKSLIEELYQNLQSSKYCKG